VTENQGTHTILLVGNPNVGKSVIFAYLTGRYAVVSNYPGTTVEVARGKARFDETQEVVDTPGVNSLFPRGEDERVTRDILLHDRGATVVQVADAKNLHRALFLTSQLAELGCRTILVLNMMDEARQRGISIDTKELGELIGIEIIETVAVEKRGLGKIVQALSAGSARVPDMNVRYNDEVLGAIEEARRVIPDPDRFGRLGIVTLVSGDRDLIEMYEGISPEASGALMGSIAEWEGRLPHSFSHYIASSRRDLVERLIGQIVTTGRGIKLGGPATLRRYAFTLSLAAVTLLLYILFGADRLAGAGLHPTALVLLAVVGISAAAGSERLNRAMTHPILGLIMLAAVLYLLYMLVGVFAAGTLVNAIEDGVFGGFLVPLLQRLIGIGWLRELLVGEFGLISMGLNYSISIVLPIVTVFFLAFGILEDTGYFPRLTVLTNKSFRFVGVNGKATLPIVLGFGCVTMATLASRILETKKERIIVVTLLALAVPCSAQLGVILALAAALSLQAVLLIAGIIFVEFILVGRIMSVLIKGATSDFILELPPLRAPKISNILLKTWARVKWFLREALPFFLLATFILYLLDVSGGLRFVYTAVRPVVVGFLGLPVETAQVFIVGFFRRDYGAAGLYKLWEDGLLAGNQIVVALLVMSLFLPCLATLIVMIKELGLRWALGILLFVMAMSLLSGGLLNLVLGLSGITI
jgi:ferrous iron transport protein B